MGVVNKNQAVQLLKNGQPVALPTETVYGLAAPINQPEALQKIFELKKRPLEDPLIVHVSSLEMALSLIKTPANSDFQQLAASFWPGPLTLVTQKNKSRVPDLITSNLNSVAIRMPQSKVFLEVIETLGTPLAAPSANLFKKVSPTRSKHILQTLPGVSVVDGGSARIGIESTIYSIEEAKVLRPGHITALDIENALQNKVSYEEKLFTPGSEEDHYQPDSPVYVFEDPDKMSPHISKSSVLKLSGEAQKDAQNFYDALRRLDVLNKPILIFFKKEWLNQEAWRALKNRIKKTSTQWIS